MNKFASKFILVLASITLFNGVSSAQRFHLSNKQMTEVIDIANGINLVNPLLEESKYLEYAVAIHKAAARYAIEPTILIAIAQQESGFRENLPEGAAGEIGIIQIRKMWLHNPKFVHEFKKQSIADLKKPAKSFLYAAWILKGLQTSTNASAKGTLPYWSYYNSVHFENRFKYFLAVNRNIATLRRFDPTETRLVASIDVKSNKLARNDSEEKGRWIPDAIRKVQKQSATQTREAFNAEPVRARIRRPMLASPLLIRAAVEVDATNTYQQKALQD